MQLKIKRTHPDAAIPVKKNATDAGLDLTAVSIEVDDNGIITYDCGLAFEIPEGYFGLLTLRSSNCNKDLILTNHVGVIDSDYRGSVKAKFRINKPYYKTNIDAFKRYMNNGNFVYYKDKANFVKSVFSLAKIYAIGERFAQLIILPLPQYELQEVDTLSETNRGEGGYGSTGR